MKSSESSLFNGKIVFESERGKIKTAPLTQRDRRKRKINGEIEWKMKTEKELDRKKFCVSHSFEALLKCESIILSPLSFPVSNPTQIPLSLVDN